MTVAQMLDQLETTLQKDVFKSRAYGLRFLNLVHQDLIEDGELLNEVLSKTLSDGSNAIDLSADNIKKVISVHMLSSSSVTWFKTPKAQEPVSTYASTTLSQWYYELIGNNLTFNKTATVDISVKTNVVKKATALTDGSNVADKPIDKFIIDGTIMLLTNSAEYTSWLWNLAIPKLRESVFGVQSFARKQSFF